MLHNFRLKRFSGLSIGEKLKWLLFILIFAFAAFRRFSLPLLPFIDDDAAGYLSPALSFLQYHHFGHLNARSFPYPLFVLVVSWPGHSLNAITVTQHIFGLLTGVLIFEIWELDFFKGYGSKGLALIKNILQLTCAAYFLLASKVIIYEHTARPESLAIFLMVLLVFLMLKNLSLQQSSLRILSAGILLVLFTTVFFPRFGFAAEFTIAVIAVALVRLNAPFRKKMYAVAIPVGLFAALVVLPEKYLVEKYEVDANHFFARQFFYSHVDIAKRLIAEDAGTNKGRGAFTANTLHRIDSVLVIETPADNHFHYLGFSPDEMLYGHASKDIDSVLNNGNPMQNEQSLIELYNRQIITRGLPYYLQRVEEELYAYYLWNPGYERMYLYEPHPGADVYSGTRSALLKTKAQSGQYFEQYRTGVKALPAHVMGFDLGFIRLLYHLLQFTFLPVVLSFLVVYFLRNFQAVKARLSELRNFNLLGKACLILTAIHFGLVLTVATVHTFGIERYGESIFAIAMLLQLGCLFYLCGVGWMISKERRR